MIINYWDCKFNDYDESWDGVEEVRYYLCSHPEMGRGTCPHRNKYGGMKAECRFAELGADKTGE